MKPTRPIDHARAAWRTFGKPLLRTVAIFAFVVNVCLWAFIVPGPIPACWRDAPGIDYGGAGGYGNASARYRWLNEHPGVCYQTMAQAFGPVGAFLAWWGPVSLAGALGAIAALVVAATGRAIVTEYRARLRIVVAEREEIEHNER